VAATISVYVEGRRVGDYLAQNISSGGALLANGPELDPGRNVQTIVRLHGACTLHLDATTVRAASGKHDGKIAITFRAMEADREDAIHAALLQALERSSEASILVVHRSVTLLSQLAESIAGLGRRPVLAHTPLDAILWLCDPDTNFDAALIDSELDLSQGATLLQFLKDEHPAVRRVAVRGEIASAEIGDLIAAIDAEAVLTLPSTPSRLREVIQPTAAQ
jgi:CheY-like chemotaxis protein